MGLSASQGRMLLLTARKSDLEFRAQQISQKRLVLAQQLEDIATDYEEATSNRQMKISLFLNDPTSGETTTNKASANLTYANLISGALALGPEFSGLIAASYTADQEYTSNSAYRLVDVDGAIVVASKDEIPKVMTESVPDKNTVKNGLTVCTNKDANGKVINTSYYFIPPTKTENGKTVDSALKTALGSADSCEVDPEKGIARVITGDKTRYYNIADGSDVTETTTISDDAFKARAHVVASNDEIPQSTIATESEYTLKEGADGKITLIKNGKDIARYVIDPALRNGITDANSGLGDPNYLQDCLRNGKYLVQRGSQVTDSVNNEMKYQWKHVSWDATTNIQDGYYQEDDDTAKAKYDRLQTQIQNQDKKLEIELDNIETQRSAVDTEMESVKKVIDENVEGSFKTFA